MGLFVLAERSLKNHAGWSVCYDLETVLEDVCDATILHPLENEHIKIFNFYKISTNRLGILGRYSQQFFKSWYSLEQPVLDSSSNILLLVGMSCDFLLSIFALGPLIKRFDYRFAYLLDGFDPSFIYKDVVPLLDHLFVISAELADEIKNTTSLKVSFLPLAINTCKFALNPNQQRFIDVISYGRANLEVHQQLQRHFNHQKSDRVYFHSTFTHGEVDNLKEHFDLLHKLLNCSKISLCFEASQIPRFKGSSPLLYRWFEAWAAGCTVVGRRPFGQGVADLMNWENSVIDIPDDSSQWLPFFEELLDNKAIFLENAQRNYRECIARHDWRYRIKEMLETVGLPVPEKLNDQILALRQKLDP